MSEKHETSVWYGDWHRFAYCKTCKWEGPRVGVSYRGPEVVQWDQGPRTVTYRMTIQPWEES